MDGQQQYQGGGYDRGGDQERRNEYQHTQPPSFNNTAGSPPPTASPFAFAPPPLSNQPGQGPSRPTIPPHHSEPTAASSQNQYYAAKQPPALPPHHNSFPGYAGSAPMHYRSFSGESSRQTQIPSSPQHQHHQPPQHQQQHSHYQQPQQQQQHPYQQHVQSQPQEDLSRPGSMNMPSTPTGPPQPSPTTPYALQRQQSHPQYSTQSLPTLPSPHQLPNPIQSPPPQRMGMYPPSYYNNSNQGPYPLSQPLAAPDMPRSLSYPTQHGQHPHSYQPYPSPYAPSMSAPNLLGPHSVPIMNRNNTTSTVTAGMANIDLSRPTLGYSFANRLPLVDRPFKCDECVQSFNRNHDLKRHKRIHLSVKPFGCDKCGKTFSRKDALRRHWLVKGCRGEDGATAPITPMFPINSAPPALSPSPPGLVSPTERAGPSQSFPPSMSFGHPQAPPHLSSLPIRHASSQSSLLVTPNEANLASQQSAAMPGGPPPPIEEPLVIDPALGGPSGSGSSGPEEGYFEGVVGIKSDGTAVMEKTQGISSPYQRLKSSPQSAVHRRASTIPSSTFSGRPYTPVEHIQQQNQQIQFAMPFTPTNRQYGNHDGLLAPPAEMERQASAASQGSVEGDWQQPTVTRWHRPSFPFPPRQDQNIYVPNFENSDQVNGAAPMITTGYNQ